MKRISAGHRSFDIVLPLSKISYFGSERNLFVKKWIFFELKWNGCQRNWLKIALKTGVGFKTSALHHFASECVCEYNEISIKSRSMSYDSTVTISLYTISCSKLCGVYGMRQTNELNLFHWRINGSTIYGSHAFHLQSVFFVYKWKLFIWIFGFVRYTELIKNGPVSRLDLGVF